jgi:CheY-like chemotaxis protein
MSAAPLSILVVDDNADAAETLAKLLRLDGCDVRAAMSGREALAQLNGWQPDVALLDLAMPKMDGFAIAQHFCAGAVPRPLLAAITGFGDAETAAKAKRVGFDHHFLKGEDPDTIRAMLRDHAAQIGRGYGRSPAAVEPETPK